MCLQRSSLIVLAAVLVFGAGGCSRPQSRIAPHVPVAFSQYRCGEFEWLSIRRVVILPLWNESTEARAAQEIRDTLFAELQAMGLFEVLIAPLDAPPEWSRQVRVSGRFDEWELVELARAFHADTVLCGAVTHYHAYSPPRVGLSLRLISTVEGVVIASVDGLWDARDQPVAADAGFYYERALMASQATSGPDFILTSPRLFQKYVCAQAAWVLGGPARAATPIHATSPAAAEAAPP